ncbi:8-amino-7-oxononanoate synthase [Shewanella sp. C32]|uniref:8-amino-7-oxononanoate synthase n=1 Tax=Shewanella electrica TaxID=515560 RepID=A0ABT2FLD2_9GAMM|nr:8-amino-7-oxononanoate synthase [Shewanella electrica]MCH1924796.1 8-amino-7-oxononanoate synthase [Shewanella electrica]MCS4556757.1 8-amino-7-oxononanoate synthase [Shewanella electrica]
MGELPLLARITARQQQLHDSGLLRQRRLMDAATAATVTADNANLHNFASNDYLGLSRAPQVAAALFAGAQQYGVGSTASPLVCGYSSAHQQLEHALCAATGAEAALLFSSGFSANSALIKTLFNGDDTVVADKLVHASMIDGLRDAKVKLKRYQHNDLAAAERLLSQGKVTALLTETIFSMDGDCAPLHELAALCQQYDCPLIVDDAHGFLLADTLQVVPFARLITFGKTLGCQGAAIVGSQQLIDFLVANCREYIYSTALSPACCVAAQQALQLATEPPLVAQLQQNIALFRQLAQQAKLPLLASASAIQPLLICASEQVMQVAQQLRERGFLVGAIRPPTVPQGSSRLRITLSAAHSTTQISALIAALVEVLADAG